jgi:hypothetical protein
MIARLQSVLIDGWRGGFIAIRVPITYLPLARDTTESDTPAGLGGP